MHIQNLCPAGHHSDGISHGDQLPYLYLTHSGDIPWSGTNLIPRLVPIFPHSTQALIRGGPPTYCHHTQPPSEQQKTALSDRFK